MKNNYIKYKILFEVSVKIEEERSAIINTGAHATLAFTFNAK